MKFFSKIFILFVSVTLLRLVVGCCRCENDFYSFDYTSVNINNIDDSGQSSDVNEMNAAGVAFEIQIIGSEVVASRNQSIPLSGFTTLSAQDCNCEDQYVPNQTISEIHIRTLYEINEDYCCNDEVTSIFLANSCTDCEDIGSFYITIDELLKRINPESLYYTPVNKFLIYLKETVENEVAQFEIEVVFSDGQSIITQTELITIV